jgi:hypothetical protein
VRVYQKLEIKAIDESAQNLKGRPVRPSAIAQTLSELMPAFLARVELLDVGDDDTVQLYEQLHGYMEEQGYSRTIGANDGAVKQLPPGVYRLAAEATAEAAYKLADQAVARTKKKARIIVVRFDAWWGNLAEAT